MGYLVWFMVGTILLLLGIIITLMRADRLNSGDSAVSEKINKWILRFIGIAVICFFSFVFIVPIGEHIFLKNSTHIHTFRDGELYEENGKYFILEKDFFDIDEPLKKKWIETDLAKEKIKAIKSIRELEKYILYIEE